ncbi:MAG: hypothetical protein Q4E02_04850 [Lagierella massiliensis]|nr:hypothetical protein [Lagierella massiliensis]
MKKIRNFIFLSVICVLSLPSAFGYWKGSYASASKKSEPCIIQIGIWYVEQDPFKTGDDPTVIPGENYVPDKPYSPNDVILGPDGNFHEILVDVPEGTEIDFDNPNTNIFSPMVWTEDTKYYRWFHHYTKGDFVWFNGFLYRYKYNINHNPNTIDQKSPGEDNNNRRWEYMPNAPTDMWIRTKVYMVGDVVSYGVNGQAPYLQYVCIKDYSANDHPVASPIYWKLVEETPEPSETSKISLENKEKDKDKDLKILNDESNIEENSEAETIDKNEIVDKSEKIVNDNLSKINLKEEIEIKIKELSKLIKEVDDKYNSYDMSSEDERILKEAKELIVMTDLEVEDLERILQEVEKLIVKLNSTDSDKFHILQNP